MSKFEQLSWKSWKNHQRVRQHFDSPLLNSLLSIVLASYFFSFLYQGNLDSKGITRLEELEIKVQQQDIYISPPSRLCIVHQHNTKLGKGKKGRAIFRTCHKTRVADFSLASGMYTGSILTAKGLVKILSTSTATWQQVDYKRNACIYFSLPNKAK